jgi:hypothetical protein
MPKCRYCGKQMIVLKHSDSGLSGGGGAKYKCPNSPHPKCPKCDKTMIKPLDSTDKTYTRRLSKYECLKCKGEF